MKQILQRTTLSRRMLAIAVSCILIMVFAVILANRAHAQAVTQEPGERLITVHDNGSERGLLTRATTLREAFKEAGIMIDPHDLVEPDLDEQLVASNYEVNIYRARPVTIVDGKTRVKVMSPHRIAKQIAKSANITLQDEDITTIRANSDIVSEGAGVQLVVIRATQFTLVLYGRKTTAYTQAKNVADMLKEKEITLGKDDTISVAMDAQMTQGMTVEIWRNGTQTITEEQEVPFEIEKVQDMDREVGHREVKTKGEPGRRVVTFEIEMRNGQEVNRKEIQSVITKEPKKQVEIVGGKLANTFNGSFADALAQLRMCESGGAYDRNSGNGYYGAYQYDISTWGGYGGFSRASEAPPNVQDEKVWETYRRRGWQPWPACSRKLGLQDIYR